MQRPRGRQSKVGSGSRSRGAGGGKGRGGVSQAWLHSGSVCTWTAFREPRSPSPHLLQLGAPSFPKCFLDQQASHLPEVRERAAGEEPRQPYSHVRVGSSTRQCILSGARDKAPWHAEEPEHTPWWRERLTNLSESRSGTNDRLKRQGH